MKKFFKYLGIWLGSLGIIFIIFFLYLLIANKNSTLFLEAAQNRNFSEMKRLINQGFDLEKADFLGTKIIRSYLTMGLNNNADFVPDAQVINFMIKNGAAINEIIPNKPSPLHLAILQKRADIVQLLVLNGVDVNYQFKTMTALDLALKTGEYEIVNLLIAHNAKFNHLKNDFTARTIAQQCVYQQQCSEELLDIFSVPQQP